MAISPGNPAYQLPPSEDTQVRRIADLERELKELRASIPRSFASTVAQLIFPTSGGAVLHDFTLTTSWQTLAQFNVSVPDGYTTAVILASGFVTSRTIASGDSDFLSARININGIWSTTNTSMVRLSYGPISVPVTGLARIDGLTAGGSVPVNIEASLFTGPGDDYFTRSNIIAQVLFLH